MGQDGMTSETVRIAPRFNGPPGSGNGGYVCGMLARRIGGACEATLRAPPPLDAPLTLARTDGRVSLRDGDTLLGEARPAVLTLEAPPAPRFVEAQAAERRYVGLRSHRYPTCFTCGLGRPAKDGLHLCTGPVEGRPMVACTWTPADNLADGKGRVASEFIHAALDCPSYWSLPRAGEMAALLARLTSSIDAEAPRVGEPLIVAAWPLKSEGRKHVAASALYHADGRLIARAEALWIEPRSAR
jgi:hypothetical protein